MGEKVVMRFLGFLLFAAGLTLSFAPANILSMVIGREAARAALYASGAFSPATLQLSPAMAPAVIRIEMREGGAYDPASGDAALALVIGQGGATRYAEPLAFVAADRDEAADGTVLYARDVTRFTTPAEGDYQFTLSEGDADPIDLRSVDVVVLANALAGPEDLGFYGNILMWVGALLFFLGLRRRKPAKADTPEPPAPPAPKWGRGA
jgi:hypothetical protein